MTRIVVLDGYTINPGDNPWTELAALGELEVYDRSTPAEARARIVAADIALTNKVLIDAPLIAHAPRLSGICVLATGVNVVDAQAASARGIPVCNVPAYSTASVVQHTLALLLELCHRVGWHDESVHRGEWAKSVDFSYRLSPIFELEGKALGIVGHGAIGRRVGEAARALGMVVRAAQLGHAASTSDTVERLSLDELFRRSDVISLHCPLSAETAGLVSRARLASMKPHALIVNTARGGLVDEAALAAALEAGQLGGAALDVLSTEPPRADNPLLAAKNCVITPHVAWTSLESRQRLLSVTAENIRALLAGSARNVTNPDYARAP